jgi:hypothetical protein
MLCLAIVFPAFPLQSPNIGSMPIFPADNPWNWDISDYAVHPNSANFVAGIGAARNLHPDFGTVWAGAPNGIPYIAVDGREPDVPVVYTAYGDESDPGPFPIPLNAPIEGGPSSSGDRHVIAVDTSNKMLYELFSSYPQADHWEAASGAAFDLSINDHHPETWTSADAAGLPIFPGLVRYEDVHIKGEINHALRFTVERSQRKYIFPARHYASSSTDPNLPPMGLRFRLKAGFDISGFSAPVQVILRALKKHGMLVADNGGNWFISGAPDDRWDDGVLGELKSIAGSNFEAVRTVDSAGSPIYPASRITAGAASRADGVELDFRPNPFYGWPKFYTDRTAQVRIYDVRGRLAHIGVEKPARPLSPGVYLCRVVADARMIQKKMVKLK